jgi:hypothetical protein
MLSKLGLASVLWISLTFLGCQKVALDPNFVALYSELILASSYYGTLTTNGAIVRKQILDHYQYDHAKFEAQFALLSKNPTLWTGFVEEVVLYLEGRKTKQEESDAQK